MSQTVADVDLIFKQTAPAATEVAQTLKEGVNNPNITTNLTIDGNSVTVSRDPTATTAAPATATTAAPATATTAAPATATTAAPATVTGEPTTTTTAVSTTAAATTAAPATAAATTTAAPATAAASTAAPATAAATTAAPVTATASTDPPTADENTVTLKFSLNQTFSSDLSNPSTTAFKALAATVVSEVNTIYSNSSSGIASFKRSIVDNFTSGSVVTQMRLVFPKASVPSTSLVTTAMKNAISSTSLSVIPNTISATVAPTAAPATVAVAEALITKRLRFRSAGETDTFTADLLNPSSSTFRDRSKILKENLEPFYRLEFSTFRSLTVFAFSNGSIINDIDLSFSSSSPPSDAQIVNVLVKAAGQVTAFHIDTTSITVNGILCCSSGARHNTSIFTALSLVVLAWLFSSQQ